MWGLYSRAAGPRSGDWSPQASALPQGPRPPLGFRPCGGGAGQTPRRSPAQPREGTLQPKGLEAPAVRQRPPKPIQKAKAFKLQVIRLWPLRWRSVEAKNGHGGKGRTRRTQKSWLFYSQSPVLEWEGL